MADPPAASVPATPLIPRSADGIAGYVFQLLDDIAAGKPIDMARINAVDKTARTFNGLVRTAIALEKHRLTGARGIVINHENGAAEQPKE